MSLSAVRFISQNIPEFSRNLMYITFVAAANDVNSSGADEPAAIKVAPATDSDKSSFMRNVGI